MATTRTPLGEKITNASLPASGLRTGRAHRGQNNFEALAKKLSTDSDERARLLAAPKTLFLHDHNAPTVRARRIRTRREFSCLMRIMLVEEGFLSKECSDRELEQYCFHKSRIIDFVCMFLMAVGSCDETNRGRVGEKMQVGSLRQRAESLWWYTVWYLLDEAGSIYAAWKLKTEAAIYQVAVDYSLGTERWKKEYFGVPELWLLMKTICYCMEDCSEWMGQNYIFWVVTAVTGARPGSLGLIPGYKEQEHYLRWRDIRFLRFEDRRGLFLEIKLWWLKGQRDPHSPKAAGWKGATFVIFPVKTRANLCADLTWLLPLMAIERGLFPGATLEDLESSPLSELTQDKKVADQPVFLARSQGNVTALSDKPLNSNATNPVLQRVSRLAGMPVHATVYCFRREFITSVGKNASPDQAKELAAHASTQTSSYGRYDFGMGDIDVVGIRFGESELAASAEARNRLRERLASPAITKLNTPFDEQECKSYVKTRLLQNETVLAFDEVLKIVASTLCNKFELASPSISKIIDGLVSLTRIGPSEITIQHGSIGPVCKEHAYEWIEHFRTVNDAGEAKILFQSFLAARKTNRQFVSRHIRSQYTKAWEESGTSPTLEQIAMRRDNLRDPTLVLTPAFSTLPAISSKAQPQIEAWKATKQTGHAFSTPFEQEIDAVVWNGQDLDDVGDEDEEVEEGGVDLQEDYFDRLDDGAKIVVTALEDEQEPLQLPGDEDEAYTKARSSIIAEWKRFSESGVHRGPSTCLFCQDHVWNIRDTRVISGSRMDRHIRSHNANSTTGPGTMLMQYAQWCEDDGKFICRICKEKGVGGREKAFASADWLSRHIKKEHVAFTKRLLVAV